MSEIHPDFLEALKFWAEYHKADAEHAEIIGRPSQLSRAREAMYRNLAEHLDSDGGAGLVYLAKCHGWKGGAR